MKLIKKAIKTVIYAFVVLAICFAVDKIDVQAALAQATDGNWYYYNNGSIDTNFTSVVQNEYGWWRVKNGMVDFSYTGVAQNQNGWWRIRNGKVDFSYTGIAQNEYGWWRIVNGKVDFSYTGVAQNEYGWWRVQDGCVNFGYNGLAQNEYGWWYIRNGKVDFGYNGVAQHTNGYWAIKNGKVDFGCNNVVDSCGAFWRVTNGYATRISDLELLTAMLYCEACGECDEGKKAVVSVIENRKNSRQFPNTYYEVLTQKGQFSPYREGKLARVLNNREWFGTNCEGMVKDVVFNGVTGDWLYFWNVDYYNSVEPEKKPAIELTQTIGNHIFWTNWY